MAEPPLLLPLFLLLPLLYININIYIYLCICICICFFFYFLSTPHPVGDSKGIWWKRKVTNQRGKDGSIYLFSLTQVEKYE